MYVTREIPVERPPYEDNPEKNEKSQEFDIIKMPDNKPLEEKTKTSNFKHKHKYEIAEMFEIPPKVSLSWKKNIESVINWMENHMEAFHETHDGFLVDFIGDDWKKWYKVVPQHIYEVGDLKDQVEINWKKYNILEHTFTKDEHKIYEEIEKDMKEKKQKKGIKKYIKDITNHLWDVIDNKNIKKK